MKAFLEEYGLVIVVIIVVAVLIALAVYFSTKGKADITNTYDQFTSGAQSIVNQSLQNAATEIENQGKQH
ncbi:MAG: hypothetical protein IKP66_05970 [Lachnospiraceae bacterium]|nr:hypothetical protein [Lachnospiraceae bacterium]